MQKLLFLAATLAAALCVSAAYADGADDAPAYLGLDLGHVSVSRGSPSTGIVTRGGFIDGSSSSWSLLGGYYFTDHLGMELGYHDYGKPAASEQSGLGLLGCPQYFSCPQVTAETAEFLGKVEVVPQLDGILRLGIQEWNIGSPGSTLVDKTNGTAFIYGIGVSHHFDYGLNLDITYEHSSFTTGETRIGFSYSF